MRNRYKVAAVVMICVGIAYASTKMRDLIITSSTIDSTPIGQTSPSSVNATTLQLNSAAPSGHTLVGNGTDYVDTPPSSAVDEFWSQSACDVTAGAANNCSFTITLPESMADANYTLVCQLGFVLTPNPTAFLNYAGTRTNSSQLAYVTEVMGNSQSGSFSTTVDCYAHHD